MNPQTRRQARLWLALVFVLGGAIGAAFGYAFAHRSYASTLPPQMSEPERRSKRVAEMTSDIGLTPEQSKDLDSILAAAHEQMKKVHDKSDADIDALRQSARNQTRMLLTDEQKPKFEAFIQKIDTERKKQMPPQR
jgi:hypothetical protein